MTVQRLINLLKIYNPDEPIVFQFLLAEHTSYSPEQFEEIADFIEDSGPFGEDTARVLREWCETAVDEIESQDA
jgi:hypothetical protein